MNHVIERKSSDVNRRGFLISSATVAAAFAADVARGETGDPWSPSELIEPTALVKELIPPAHSPQIICVTFPILYRQKHIPGAQLAGPADKPDGVAKLRTAVVNLPRNGEIVIYCGCCPMNKCPNVRPAYRELKGTGFKRIRVLNLPTNFHTDWVVKGYPVAS